MLNKVSVLISIMLVFLVCSGCHSTNQTSFTKVNVSEQNVDVGETIPNEYKGGGYKTKVLYWNEKESMLCYAIVSGLELSDREDRDEIARKLLLEVYSLVKFNNEVHNRFITQNGSEIPIVVIRVDIIIHSADSTFLYCFYPEKGEIKKQQTA